MADENRKLKIVSWNVNGMRTTKNGIKDLLSSYGCDVLCLQETKITRDQLDEETAILNGYNSYYSFSRVKGGYSGVATICRDEFTPIAAEEGLSGVIHSVFSSTKDIVGEYGDILEKWNKDELLPLDSEGRCLVTKHKIKTCDGKDEFLTIINVYCPHASPENKDRLNFKFQFFELLKQRAESLLNNGSHVVILGDFNTIHKEIDSSFTEEYDKFTKGMEWLDSLLISLPLKEDEEIQNGDDESKSEDEDEKSENEPENSKKKFVDTFRHCHPTREEAFTCWCTKFSARTLNYGTRLDYILASVDFARKALHSSDINPDVMGSDHCPVTSEFNCHPIATKTCPFLCTKNWPEFSGKQQTLKSFFQKIEKPKHDEPKNSPPKKKQKTDQKTLSSFFKKSQPVGKAETPSQISLVEPNISSENKSQEKPKKNADAADKWKNMFKKNTTTPMCSGHNEPSLLRTVKKPGANCGRQFYCCSHPDGPKSNPLSRCNFFVWK